MGEVRFTRRKMLAAAAATPVSLMLGKGARAAGGAVGPLPAEPSSANPAEHRGAPALARGEAALGQGVSCSAITSFERGRA
jgi:hypothetical protein